jgi:hypothetical protein
LTAPGVKFHDAGVRAVGGRETEAREHEHATQRHVGYGDHWRTSVLESVVPGRFHSPGGDWRGPGFYSRDHAAFKSCAMVAGVQELHCKVEKSVLFRQGLIAPFLELQRGGTSRPISGV